MNTSRDQSRRTDAIPRVALITGGTGGLGSAIAQRLLASGMHVALGSRSSDRVRQAVAELSHDNDDHRILGVELDVSQDQSVDDAVERVEQHFGSIHVLVNAAGFTQRRPALDVSSEDFLHMLNVHVGGTFRCSKACAAVMRRHGGSIINFASIAAYNDLVEVSPYSTSKAAVMGLTRALANEWAKFAIRINAIVSGFVPTKLNRELIIRTDRGRRVLERTPLGRFGRPEEIASAVYFLASNEASFITGHGLVVDGGFLACGVGDTTVNWEELEVK